MKGLFFNIQYKKYEDLAKKSEYFGQQICQYKKYFSKKGAKTGGAFVNDYTTFFARRKDFQKTLTSLGWALKWKKKYQNWSMQEVRNHLSLVLARMAQPHTMIILRDHLCPTRVWSSPSSCPCTVRWLRRSQFCCMSSTT